MKIFLKIGGILFLMGIFLNAFATKVEIQSDSSEITLNESTSISVSVFDLPQVEDVSLVGIKENFQIISSSQMYRMTFDNGKQNLIKTYKFYLLPKKRGEFKIHAEVYSSQRKYKSTEIEIKVLKNSMKTNAKGQDIFLETILAPKKAYMGQKILYVVNFYTHYFGVSSPYFEPLELKSFIVKDITPKTLVRNYISLSGHRYLYYQLQKFLLLANNPGKYEIPARQFRIRVQDGQAGGFFDIGKVRYLQTEKQNIQILPLPEAKRPKNFNGLVGEAKLDYEISTKMVNFGEPIKIKVKITGDLNLDSLDKIIDINPENFKIYQNEVNYTEDMKNGKYLSQKEFELVLVAEKGGELKFPEIKVPYFNTKLKKYDYLSIPSFNVVIKGGNTNYAESEDLIIRVRKPIDNSDFSQYFILKIKKNYFWISIGILLVAFLLTYLNFHFKPFKKKIKSFDIEKKWEELNSSPFSVEKAFVFLDYLCRELIQNSLNSLDHQNIERMFLEKNYSLDVIKPILETLNCIELEKYSMPDEKINYQKLLQPVYEKLFPKK